jgi:exodeoxyribonuclease V beta subunit
MPKLLATPLDAHGAASTDPLRGLPSGFSLSKLERGDRLDELEFNLRLGAGVQYERHAGAPPGARPGCVDSRRIQSALEAALDATAATAGAVDPVRAWVEHHLGRAKNDGKQLVAEIAGILTGSIDLVFRTKADGQRFFVVDYKTNMIETSTLGHFTGPWLAWKMATTGYPLQALIYTVALHRHLGVRMGRRYDYDQHVGGYLYLFVRGMVGADTPRCPTTGRCMGVFAHRWTKQTIELMDEALGAGVSA